MASRPTVSIASGEGKPTGATTPLPAVFAAPIRADIVQYVRPVFSFNAGGGLGGIED
ncbi:hypothetical protein BDV18DRAFT_141546 [Aspergillus unguis]